MAYDKVSQLRNMMNQHKTAANSENENIGNEATESDIAIDSASEQSEPTVAAEADESAALRQSLESLESQLKEQKEGFLRRTAEYENSRKRLEKDKDEAVKYANEKLLNDIFPVLDSLEMTLSHAGDRAGDPIVSGVELVLKQFYQILNKYGLEEVGSVGEVFDPNFHEAIASEPTDAFESGHVTRVHRKGYKLKDRLIRAALVSVSQ